jgi:hypothetical protein
MMTVMVKTHIDVGPYHHRVADGRDGLQVWRVAVNVLNK